MPLPFTTGKACFYVILNLIYKYFAENFCVYVHDKFIYDILFIIIVPLLGIGIRVILAM